MKRAFLQFVNRTGRHAVLVLCLIAALVFAGWLLLLDVSIVWFLVLSVIAIPVGSGAVALLIGTLFSGLPPIRGAGIEREDAPKLWEIVDNTFGEANARNVRLFMSPDLDAWIATSRRHFGFFGEVIHLNMGLALFKVCAESDIEAVIRHEFAHLRHRDTNGSRNLAEFERSFDTLFEFAPPGETIIGSLTELAFGRVHLLLAKDEARLSREAELAADRAASAGVRPIDMASSLYRLSAAERFFAKTIHEPVRKEVLGSMRAPKSGFERILELPDPICGDEMFRTCWEEALEEEEPDPLASHPSPDERLLALGMDRAWHVAPVDTPAITTLIPVELLDRARKEFEEAWHGELEFLYER